MDALSCLPDVGLDFVWGASWVVTLRRRGQDTFADDRRCTISFGGLDSSRGGSERAGTCEDFGIQA